MKRAFSGDEPMPEELRMSGEERNDLLTLVRLALAEDLGSGDVTADALVPESARAEARFLAKARGVLAGIEAARAVFEEVDPALAFRSRLDDGAALSPGTEIARVAGNARSILAAERTALNFLQRLSGVASLTRRFVEAVEGTLAGIFDTRKTLPGFRRLDKYAVRVGGGRNHRRGLFDQVLIKENHLAAAGEIGPGEAVRRARAGAPATIRIEVEVESLDEFREALAAAPDIVMLDDMSLDEVREAVALRGRAGKPELEVSGGVRLDTVRSIAALGVDRISVGALTHSAPALDISMKFSSSP
jgi:nicotinate-nucleotide pyrophosphorylase (carboxylating)